ncbi:PAS domain-containing sensor histidine kinase [Paraburkholderia sp. J8-2]|uniref:PAS domain-containing sensor histidine kinase n=1 Tax=Paraburkholderia sp. J8-2 TaxID=2805440 RepID=UPI002AB69BAF|nr:PAS domain-containing sensor histidine kinase [Paraburkholderia sp. J8-2]
MSSEECAGNPDEAPTSGGLENARDRFQLMLDLDGDFAVFTLDSNGCIETWNTAAERVTGYGAGEIVGKPLTVLFAPDFAEGAQPMDAVFSAASKGQTRYEGWHVRKDGARFWANVVVSAQRHGQGDLAGFAAVALDASERLLYEARLRRSEEKLRLMIDSVQDYAIFMLSTAGIVISWNSGARKIKGYAPDEILGHHFSVFYTPEDQAAGLPQQLLATAAAEGRAQSEGWRVRRDGSRFWADVVISAIRDSSGTLQGFSKVTRDLTERRRLNELERAVEIATAAERAREAEKARVARELHDDLGQQLAALKLYAAENERAVESGVLMPDHAKKAHALASQIDGMMTAVRRIAADLRPTLLDDLGLVPAVEWLAEDFSRRFRVNVQTRLNIGDLEFNETAATAIFRIVQEALTNVARHAHATRVCVSIEVVGGECKINVEDDGIGVNPDEPKKEKSFGLLGIGERVRQLGGSARFANTQEGGFKISVTLPISAVKRI